VRRAGDLDAPLSRGNLCLGGLVVQARRCGRRSRPLHPTSGTCTCPRRWQTVSSRSCVSRARRARVHWQQEPRLSPLRHACVAQDRYFTLPESSARVHVRESVTNLVSGVIVIITCVVSHGHVRVHVHRSVVSHASLICQVAFERVYGCAQHVTLSEPWLSDACEFECNSDKGCVAPFDMGEHQSWKSGAEFDGHAVPTVAGTTEDWKVFPRSASGGCAWRV
jgi:hypothetical protein